VEVTLETGDGHVVARARSNNQGEFSFPDVTPGTYATIGRKETFKTATVAVTVTASGAKAVTPAMAS
jgi:protocatechuate 3,4-dioxygenase beta subunit